MIPLIILAIEDPDDREFMTTLYLNYNRLMFSVSIKIVRDSWAAEDVVQTAVEKLIDKIPELRTKSEIPLINYIIATCRNLSIAHKKKEARYVSYEPSEADSADESASPENLMMKKETIELVSKAWEHVDEQTKQILRSKYILEMSDVEIAEEIGIKPNSVRTYVGRARNKVRDKVKELSQIV